jgi:predicted dienelactone hydrolase
MPARRPRGFAGSLLGSLLSGLLAGPLLGLLLSCGPAPARAAEQLEIRLDGLQLPLDLGELEAWSRDPDQPRGDLGTLLDLLEPRQRLALLRLLRAPLVRDRSMARQLMDSWAGQRLLTSLGGLIRTDEGNAGPQLYGALTNLLARQEEVSTIELLRGVPSRRIILNVDGVLALASQWQRQLESQRAALQTLRRLPLAAGTPRLPLTDGVVLGRGQGGGLLPEASAPQALELAVPHRQEPLRMQLWRPRQPSADAPWLLLSPGLGGSSSQLEWLAAALRERGWSVLLLDHPGSDEMAMRAWLEGRRRPPAAETVADRLSDLQAVVAAVETGRLPRLGDSVVLVGHSLGGLTSLLAAGLRPEPGLQRRCDRALDGLPLTNLSRLLQCQLPHVPLSPPRPLAQPLAAVVSLNGFGSLLWPQRGLQELKVPVLLIGGSLDLITPPLSEQLRLFLPQGHPRSRLVVLEGGSHFSPVRIQAGSEALFRLGEELVGVDPGRVQALILSLSSDFLQGLNRPGLGGVLPQRRRLGGVTAYVLDRAKALSWRASMPLPPTN